MRSHRRDSRRYSELDDLEYSYYEDLRERKTRITSVGKSFLCPFCEDHNRKEYDWLDLRRHASRIARESKSASFGDKGRHLGLLKYLDRRERSKERPSRSNKRSYERLDTFRDGKRESVKQACPVQQEQNVAEPCETVVEKCDLGAEPGEIVTEPEDVDAIAKVSVVKSCGRVYKQDLKTRTCADVKKPSTNRGDDEPIVWPWMAIVANIPVVKKDGRYTGDSGRKLKDEWVIQGYNPAKVHPLWNFQGHSGFAIVEFCKDWEGFKNAMAFEKAFEVDRRGKRDWNMRRSKGDELYGWLAREEDYHRGGLIGKHLRKNGDLKTVSDIQREDKRKDSTLMCNLTNQLESKKKECEEIKKNISRTEINMGNIMMQQEEMIQSYNEEIEKMQDSASDMLRKISEDHMRSKAELEAKREKLKSREKGLKQRQALNESEKRKLDNQKRMNEMAIMEQKKADEKLLKLAEEQQRQKEDLHKKIIELGVKLDQKQALELQIQRMRGAVEVMKHLTGDGDVEDEKKLESIEEELKDKEEELDSLESINQALVIKERMTNDELQEARKQLIHVFNDSRANICVKRMGELNEKPFVKAAKVKFAGEEWKEKALELCSLWEDYLRDPSWHPYKVVMVEGTHKEILDENDEKLKELKTELGDEVYEAVTTALNEMNEFNPSGRYPVKELWNSNGKRKASLTEGIENLLKQWKLYKPKRRRN